MNRFSFIRHDRPFIVAEIGINHNGSLETACEMIRSAASAGADAVKFQTFLPERMYSSYTKSLLECGRETAADSGITDFFRSFTFDEDEHRILKKTAEEAGTVFLSAPFDIESFELLERIGVPAYKIASSEITHIELIRHIAATGKPVLLSTGMTNAEEIDIAVEIFKKKECETVILHCVALYPLPIDELNLSRMETLRRRYMLPTGFSDHSPDIEFASAAAMLGAAVIEKHFTLSRDFNCPDGGVSVTPEQLRALIEAGVRAYEMRGAGEIKYGKEEEKVAKSARRSLFALNDIPAGKIISEEDLCAKRPGIGISPSFSMAVIGKKAVKTVKADYLIRLEDFE